MGSSDTVIVTQESPSHDIKIADLKGWQLLGSIPPKLTLDIPGEPEQTSYRVFKCIPLLQDSGYAQTQTIATFLHKQSDSQKQDGVLFVTFWETALVWEPKEDKTTRSLQFKDAFALNIYGKEGDAYRQKES